MPWPPLGSPIRCLTQASDRRDWSERYVAVPVLNLGEAPAASRGGEKGERDASWVREKQFKDPSGFCCPRQKPFIKPWWFQGSLRKAKACTGMDNFHTSYRHLFLPFIPIQSECILQSWEEEIFRLCMATAFQEFPTKVQSIRLYTSSAGCWCVQAGDGMGWPLVMCKLELRPSLPAGKKKSRGLVPGNIELTHLQSFWMGFEYLCVWGYCQAPGGCPAETWIAILCDS